MLGQGGTRGSGVYAGAVRAAAAHLQRIQLCRRTLDLVLGLHTWQRCAGRLRQLSEQPGCTTCYLSCEPPPKPDILGDPWEPLTTMASVGNPQAPSTPTAETHADPCRQRTSWMVRSSPLASRSAT